MSLVSCRRDQQQCDPTGKWRVSAVSIDSSDCFPIDYEHLDKFTITEGTNGFAVADESDPGFSFTSGDLTDGNCHLVDKTTGKGFYATSSHTLGMFTYEMNRDYSLSGDGDSVVTGKFASEFSIFDAAGQEQFHCVNDWVAKGYKFDLPE